jgi:hypothetical protein
VANRGKQNAAKNADKLTTRRSSLLRQRRQDFEHSQGHDDEPGAGEADRPQRPDQTGVFSGFRSGEHFLIAHTLLTAQRDIVVRHFASSNPTISAIDQT